MRNAKLVSVGTILEFMFIEMKGGQRNRKNMPEFDFSGSFINETNVKDGDKLVIVASPIAEEKESPQQKELVNGVLVNKKYMVLNIPVEFNGKKKTYTPDNKTGMRFQDAWGFDYSKWIGKVFSVKVEPYKSFGVDKKRVIGFPEKDNK